MHNSSKDARQLFKTDTQLAVTSKGADGETYLAIFNIGDDTPQTVSVSLKDLGLKGSWKVTGLWSGESMGTTHGKISHELAPHACVLLKLNK